MADDNPTGNPPDDKSKDIKVDVANLSLEDLAKQNPAVAKVLTDLNDTKETMQKMIDDNEAKKQEEAKKGGEFQKLFEEEQAKNKELKGQNKKLEETLSGYKDSTDKMLDKLLTGIPEEKKKLIPTEYSPRKKLDYVFENAEFLGIESPMSKGSSVPPNNAKPALDVEQQLIKEFQELKDKPNKNQAEWDLFFAKGKQIKEIQEKKRLENNKK